MASNKVAFFFILCLCVLSTAEFGEAQFVTGIKCKDGLDSNGVCISYCRGNGFLGGSCQGHTNHYMCEYYEG
ncbi:hypothetical protein ISN44_As07g018220 [Arabidopsis suecica]|uniref:Uncharacterized protein n=1 Tax=Arabidopsis suecica TaxID=45249 RepID=A0A8T2BPS8_ARASU|nr:hypothetical protein ISN44_As07g018220 [Arabidopsis suecica]